MILHSRALLWTDGPEYWRSRPGAELPVDGSDSRELRPPAEQWRQSSLDDGATFWYNGDGDISLTDPCGSGWRAQTGESAPEDDGQTQWLRGELDDGSPFWYALDGAVRLADPTPVRSEL